jgi:hypothetical protein
MADLFTRLAARAHGLDQRSVSRVAPRLPARFEGREFTPEDDSGMDSPEKAVEPTPASRAPIDAPAMTQTQAFPVAAEQPRPPEAEAPAQRVAPMDTQPPVAAGAEHISPERDAVHQRLTRPVPHEYARDPVSNVEHVEGGSWIRPAFVSSAYGAPSDGFDGAREQQANPTELASVHIRIGRIEVRATPSPSAPPAPTVPATPQQDTRLTLAAYLRGDDGRPK